MKHFIWAAFIAAVCGTVSCASSNETDASGGDVSQRLPPVERVAGPCAALPPKDAACTGQPEAISRYACKSGLDCPGEAARCSLHASFFGSTCQCSSSTCAVDADCGDGKACECGTPGKVCGRTTSCEHHCVVAECRTSADCPAGAVCSPSMDDCGWRPESYHCHDPARDACLTDGECPTYFGCRWVDGAWGCKRGSVCE